MTPRPAAAALTAVLALAVLPLTAVGASSSADAAARPYPVRGIYDRDLSATGFDDLAALGFNFIDSSPDGEDVRPLVARGLKALVWLGGYETSTCSFRRSDAWVRARVVAVRRSRGVGAYFIDDEPNAAECPGAPAQIRRRSRLVKSLDPRRTTFIVVHRIEQLARFARTVDVIGLDEYPCKVKLNGCDYSVIRQQAAVADRLGIRYWGVIQAFGADGYYKLPTPDELRRQFDAWRRTKMEGYLVFAWRYPDDRPDLWLANHPELRAQLALENSR